MRLQARVATESGSGSSCSTSFERFFRAQFATVVRIAFGVVRDVHLAEDIAQDVLIAAERRFPDPDGSEHAAAWVRVAAVHTALNTIRNRKRRDVRQSRVPPGPLATDPGDAVVEKEDAARIRRALARLPRHSAAVLVLRHTGLSYVEIADAIGVKPGNVGSMLRRAETALRKEVEREARS